MEAATRAKANEAQVQERDRGYKLSQIESATVRAETWFRGEAVRHRQLNHCWDDSCKVISKDQQIKLREEAVQELQSELAVIYKLPVTVTQEGEIFRMDSQLFIDSATRAGAAKDLLPSFVKTSYGSDDSFCDMGFRQLRLSQGDSGEDYSLGCK